MRMFVLMLTIATLTSNVFSPTIDVIESNIRLDVKEDTNNLSNLIKAIMCVESNNNELAFNPKENAAGILQIRPIMVREVNRLSNGRYTLEDRWSINKSIEIFNIFIYHYVGDINKYEEIARKWNGGPNGHLKNKTIPYWKKVKTHLSKY